MKIGIFIQARTNSTRLPGKIYLPWNDSTILQEIYKRASRVRVLAKALKVQVVILGPKQDDKLKEFCEKHSLTLYQPDCEENDLTTRYLKAIDIFQVDAAIRITADCPFTDPRLLEKTLVALCDHDYVSTTTVRSFPEGYDIQGASKKAWEWLGQQTVEDREHPFSYFDLNDHLRKEFTNAGHTISFIYDQENPIFVKTSIDTQQDYDRWKPKVAPIEKKKSR